jgi:hypothetical protein
MVALRKKIIYGDDPELVGLLEERDMLFMESEMSREVHGEWAALARKIAPQDAGCDCSVCAISRALTVTAESVTTESA